MAVKWTPEQQKVIDLRDRNILVSAAAGSGKTAVLVERILTLLTDSKHPIDMDALLIVTFTRAAAAEMKERIRSGIERLLEEDPENEHLQKQSTLIHSAQINTIDGFCSYVIRNYFHMIDLDPGFRTAEDGELRLLKRDVMKEVIESAYAQKDPAFLDFVECYATGKDDARLEDEILQLYEYSMSYPWPREWLASCSRAYEITTIDELRQTPWIRIALEENQYELHHASYLLEELMDLCQEEEQAEKYLEVLRDDWMQLQRVRELKDYDQLVEALGSVKWKRLPAVKSTLLSPEFKKIVQDGRKEVKDCLKKQQEDYFNMTLSEALSCIQRCEKPLSALVDLTIQFADAYAQKKREKNLLDFSDMEHFALDILVKKEGDTLIYSQAAKDFSQRFQEIFIDEYQDSNLVQETILMAVSKIPEGRHNIFMVGDVKQSIYRFRLARPELFMEKYHTYSLEDSPTQRIDLHKNFRSRKEVLWAVNYVFAQIMGEDLGKVEYDQAAALYPGAQYPELTEENPAATELILVEQDSPGMEEERGIRTVREMEALAVAGKIQEMVGHQDIWDASSESYRKITYGDIVILLRTTAGWAEEFSQVLESCGIPAYAASKTGYFSALEVVTVLNYLHILDNPRQDIPLGAVLHSPIGGFSAEQLAQIRATGREGDLYDSISFYLEHGEEEELRTSLQKFWRQYETLRSCVSYTPIHELILKLLHETQYDLYISAMPAGEQREANVRMLVEKAMEFEKTSYRGLFNFIRYIQQLQKYNVDYGEVNLAGGENVVQIMSIHKSKGLEFPVVFVSGLGKQFNQQDVNASLVIHPDLGMGADCIMPEYRVKMGTLIKQTIRQELKKENLGEELRVLYVALTRAKERLILTGAVSKVEKLVEDCAFITSQKDQRLHYQNRVSARCYLDWILPALARHPAFRKFYEEYDHISSVTKPAYEPEPPIGIQILSAYDLIMQQAGDLLERKMGREELEHWDSSKVYDPALRQQLVEKFSFRYPYEDQKDIPVKVTVSELKKQHGQVDEEAYDLFFEPDIVPLIPDFMKEEEREKEGAYRGTAYHRFMECIDFDRGTSLELLQGQLDQLVATGKMDESMASCVTVSDFLRFTESRLGQRMAAAQCRGALRREQPFVISQKASTMKERWGDQETILVQGIIDVYFTEEEGIVLADYKTDRVKKPQELVDRYRVQLDYYAEALERMTGKKVTEKIIYSFTLGQEIQLPLSN